MLKYNKVIVVLFCLLFLYTPFCYGDIIVLPPLEELLIDYYNFDFWDYDAEYEEKYGVSKYEFRKFLEEGHNVLTEEELEDLCYYLYNYDGYLGGVDIEEYLSGIFERYQKYVLYQNIMIFSFIFLWFSALTVIIVKLLKVRGKKKQNISVENIESVEKIER